MSKNKDQQPVKWSRLNSIPAASDGEEEEYEDAPLTEHIHPLSDSSDEEGDPYYSDSLPSQSSPEKEQKDSDGNNAALADFRTGINEQDIEVGNMGDVFGSVCLIL